MAYEKLLNEIYAAVSLKYLWPEYKPSFVKSESPDWINETMDLGLEISQALLPEDGQTESFIEQYLGCLKEELPAAALERYGDRLHFYNGRFWAVLPEAGVEQDYLSKAKYRFDSKLKKLNTNYQSRRYNGLYLFLHPTEEDDVDVEQLFVYIKRQQEKKPVRFDYVFLNCVRVIYVCNYIKNQLETIVLPQNAADFLNTESEYLRYLGKWEDGASLDEAANKI
ncbi:MAG: hypothetical protein ACOYBL_01555 [Lachnospiraceae bacterium]|jgi:hypothetical protein